MKASEIARTRGCLKITIGSRFYEKKIHQLIHGVVGFGQVHPAKFNDSLFQLL